MVFSFNENRWEVLKEFQNAQIDRTLDFFFNEDFECCNFANCFKHEFQSNININYDQSKIKIQEGSNCYEFKQDERLSIVRTQKSKHFNDLYVQVIIFKFWF